MDASTRQARYRYPLGLMLISAGSLVYEISLTRIFAVQQFHHFAFLVVGMAVMGIAASGFLIAIRPSSPPASLLALGYSGAVLLAYLIINLLPFDSYSIAWDRQQHRLGSATSLDTTPLLPGVWSTLHLHRLGCWRGACQG